MKFINIIIVLLLLIATYENSYAETNTKKTIEENIINESKVERDIINGDDCQCMKKIILSQISAPVQSDEKINHEIDDSLEKPPLNWKRIGGEFAGGTIGYSIGLGLFFALVYHECKNNPDPQCPIAGLPGIIATPFLTATGIHVAGNTSTEAGSFWRATGFSYIGLLAGSLASVFFADWDEKHDFNSIYILSPLFTIMSGLIAYNHSRYFKNNISAGGTLLQISDYLYNVRLPVPYLTIRTDRTYLEKKYRDIIFNIKAAEIQI